MTSEATMLLQQLYPLHNIWSSRLCRSKTALFRNSHATELSALQRYST